MNKVEIFKALSNAHRLTIFERLCNCCEAGTVCSLETATSMCVGDLGKTLDIAPSTVSHHMKELYRAGLVQMERRGKNIDCRVVPEALQELSDYFKQSLKPIKTGEPK